VSKVYVLFVKRFPKSENEGYVYAPSFEIHYDPVQGKVAELNPGECVDAYKANLSTDGVCVRYDLYRVSNIDGKAQEDFTESVLINRCRS